ncbi:MAG: hypothetical protein KGS61_16635, partial [Verrucomicrobia bacterium]|nr:hypothetical protein [Verrucomicrobiota bacterium]
MPMPALQEIIYHLEVGAGTRLVKRAALILGLLVLTGYYDWRDYKNFAAPEAMDTAQLARNLSTGKGFTTRFIRPLSLYLLEPHRADRDPLLKNNHP